MKQRNPRKARKRDQWKWTLEMGMAAADGVLAWNKANGYDSGFGLYWWCVFRMFLHCESVKFE